MTFDAASTITVSAGTVDGAVTLSTNSGAGNTFALSKLALTTSGTARALVLSSTGTVTNANVTSTISTADSATVCGGGNCSAAIDASSTALGLTFLSINANGANGHMPNGVSLSATTLASGATNQLKVTGTAGSAGSGGTIQKATANGVKVVSANAISLSYMNLTGNATAQTVSGAASTCGDLTAGTNTACVANLYLSGVTGVALDNVAITNSKQQGINGNNLTDLTITNSTINNNGDETGESGIHVQNLLGTNAITDTPLVGNASRAIYVETLTGSCSLTVKRQSLASMIIGNLTRPGVQTGGTCPGPTCLWVTTSQQGILFDGFTSADMTLVVDGVTVQHNFGNGIAGNTQGSSTLNGSIKNCTFDENTAGIAFQLVGTGSVGSLANPFLVQNNTGFLHNNLEGIFFGVGTPSSGAMWVKIDSNQVGNATAGSVCDLTYPTGPQVNVNGIQINRFGSAALHATITNNVVQNFGGTGMAFNINGGTDALKLDANTIKKPYNDGVSGSWGSAILVNVGASTATTACVDVTNNIIDAGDPTFGWDPNGSGAEIHYLSKNSSVFSIPGLGASTVAAYLPTKNTMAVPPAGILVSAQTATGGSYANTGSPCTTP